MFPLDYFIERMILSPMESGTPLKLKQIANLQTSWAERKITSSYSIDLIEKLP